MFHFCASGIEPKSVLPLVRAGKLFPSSRSAFLILSAPALKPIITINVIEILTNVAHAFIKGRLIFENGGIQFDGLSGGRQPPLVLQMTFHPFEHDAIDHVADGDDQDHDGDNRTHIIQIAAHHQYLAEAET